ncbi:phage tail protein [Castellaniella sp. S9]|uniref:phage tail protein n=1 Tax=Castellaniella sp. S9 TaxID=2993652 RepID=UPI0022B2E6B0|nr:phage tail protein [Castellaniella sp. S9]
MIEISGEISRKDIDRLIKTLGLTENAARAAAKRALLKTAKWTQTRARRALSNEMRIQQKLLQARLRLYRREGGMEQLVWLGLNAFAAKRLGTPRRRAGGTQVGAHFFEGAFPIKRFGGGVYRRTGRERFPLELAKLPIDEAGAAALRQAAERADERLLEVMRQEMEYELSKIIRDK